MSSTYAGLWRSWNVKSREADAEAASAAWLGDPGQSVQHMTDWGSLADVVPFDTSYDISSGAASGDPRSGSGRRQEISTAHGAANTAVGRQQLGAGHVWADPPPPLLSDHSDVPPGTFGGGGIVSGDDYDGQNPAQHQGDWGSLNEGGHGGYGTDPYAPGDFNFPVDGHQEDKGEIASKQRRQIQAGRQSSDEKDTSEQYEFAPGSAGGSTAQIKYSQVASAAVAGAPGEQIAPKHTPGAEYGRAAGPAVSWANGHGGPDSNPAVSVRNRRWVERRIPGRHFWTHDMRPLFWRLARTPGGPGTLPGATHESSPFPAGLPNTPEVSARAFSIPVIRRTPPAWDETAATDGTVDGTADTSGMWSGFGGL